MKKETEMLRWCTHFNYSPIHRATTNTRLVSFETATPFVPYISALKNGVLRHRVDKTNHIIDGITLAEHFKSEESFIDEYITYLTIKTGNKFPIFKILEKF